MHIPVLHERIVELLSPALRAPGSVYVDCTLGLGGHAHWLLVANPDARMIGIDRDADALAVAAERLAEFGDRIELVHAVYDEVADVLADLGVAEAQAILMDLGLSSLQIDRRDRGFAYSVDSPLDMRMDTSQQLTAAEVVNSYPEPELRRILRRYGEERFADRVAQRIVRAREQEPFKNSARLVEVISAAIPMATRKSGGHPAKRSFQALRIEVNAELEALEAALPAAVDVLAVDGRLAVLAYHSLEDRLVKRELRARSTDKAPRHLPVVPEGMRAEMMLLTRGAERPDEAEIEDNPRAASARLRAAQRVRRAA